MKNEAEDPASAGRPRIVTNGTQCQNDKLRLLYDLWHDLKGEVSLPLATGFDYITYPEFLDTLIVFSVLGDPFDLKYEYNGSKLTQLFHSEVTGQTLREIEKVPEVVPDGQTFASRSLDMMYQCVEERLPLLNGPKRIPVSQQDFILFESLTTPFVDAEGAVTRLVSLVDIKNV